MKETIIQELKKREWTEDRFGNMKKNKNLRVHFTPQRIRLEVKTNRHKYTDVIAWVRLESYPYSKSSSFLSSIDKMNI